MASPILSGFTFIKHGLDLGYPFIEAIECLRSFCDEVIVNVGFGVPECDRDDGTFEVIFKKFKNDSKIKIMKSYWDPEVCRNGAILAQQTDLALAQCQGRYCQYLQADEHLDERQFLLIRSLLQELDDKKLDGAVYRYLHFYGNVDILKYTRKLYRREVRLIKNGFAIKSYRDAQGFRHADGRKLNCLLAPVDVYHYGWARKEMVMKKKVDSFGKIYHGPDHQNEQFAYQRIWGLRPFEGTHPALMKNWIDFHRNDIDILKLPLSLSLADVRSIASDCIESFTGLRLGEYKNYRVGGSYTNQRQLR